MIRRVILITALLLLVGSAWGQPEFYADPFLGLPEFRVLPLRRPTASLDSVRLDVHVRVLYDDLQFIKVDDHYEAGYGLDVVLLDAADHSLAADHHDRRVSVATFELTNSRQFGDQVMSKFTLPLASVTLRVSLMDRESRKERSVEKLVEFPAKEWGKSLRLGDLALLDSAGVVQMSAGLLQGESLRALYSLFGDTGAAATIEVQIVNEKNEIALSRKLDRLPGVALQEDTLALDTRDLHNGFYHLIMTAKADRVQLRRAYPFRILWHDMPDYIQDLDLAIRQLKYIATDEEMDRFQGASPSRRETLFREFWQKQDPTPSTSTNEKMEEYYRRVRYANEHFSVLRDGWETDMGHIYIIFGPPSDVERHPFDIDKKPYEIWSYFDLNRRFLFVDEDGFGDYRLKTPVWHEY